MVTRCFRNCRQRDTCQVKCKDFIFLYIMLISCKQVTLRSNVTLMFCNFKDLRITVKPRSETLLHNKKLNLDLHPIFRSKNVIDCLRETRLKRPLVNQKCPCDLSAANSIGYLLNQQVEEHKLLKYSITEKSFKDERYERPPV